MARRDPKPPAFDDPLDSPLLQDREVERRLAGFLLLRPGRAGEVLWRVRPEHLRDTVAGAVVAAASALVERREKPHLHAVLSELRRLHRDDVTAVDVSRLTEGLAVGASWEDYAARVLDGARRRAALYALQQAVEALGEEPDFGVIRDAVYRAMDAGEDTDQPAEADGWSGLVGALSAVVDGTRVPPLSTGLARLDGLLDGGVQRAGLTILGARTSIGKTALAATVALAMAEAGHRVSFMSLEMTRERMAVRFAALATGVAAADWRRGNVTARDLEALVRERPICVDTRARTLGAVRSRAFQHRRVLGGLDAVFVDYLQLMDLQVQRGEKRYEALGRMSRGLMELAQDLDVAVFALSQLSRETSLKPEPEVSDLRESGNLEQDAEMVWLLYYPRGKDGRPVAGAKPVLKVAKNRNGPTGKVALEFDAGRMRFSDADEEAPVEAPVSRRRPRPLRPASEVVRGSGEGFWS